MKIPARLLMLFILLASLEGFGQREAAHWFFGDRAGLNFNSGFPVSQNGSLQTQEGSATISDSNGNLLFYTDGVKGPTASDFTAMFPAPSRHLLYPNPLLPEFISYLL